MLRGNSVGANGGDKGEMTRKLTVIVVITSAIGAWLGIIAIVQFAILLNGGFIHEPSSAIAMTELVLACLFTLWFVVIFPILLKRGLKDDL